MSKTEKVKIFFGKKTGYRSKDLVLPTAGIYEVTPEQKKFFLSISGGFWYEPDSPEAKAWLATQKAEGDAENKETEKTDEDLGTEPAVGAKTGKPSSKSGK